ncbi:maleylpyruvate isomerase family mycothiol-dependent enzyme [Cellulosimicrobium cellulans]|uniref:maleylpyruvate isomerase family mycothiol-dependent enzyme n=1 Tax=Cellulosimicrobium cellulans TaxID=1710 RepID=UPI001BAB1D22|nr:maleylpyruvate isomerase family mycothiol-dependent enzyme [Cellulosimicrobium cellulans]QUC00311.1 maleylpyruvate isomerase family mycothiol-dependent enzyme [Cellulosimicrobium cellulans]
MALTDAPALTPPDVEEVRRDARAALDAVTDAARGLDAAGLDAPSALPGWSRSHVLAHVTAIGEAMARQAERAARGEFVEVYDGGAAGREDGIRTGALRSVAQHVAALDALADRLDAAWPAVGSPGWSAPVTYRDGTVADALVAWWREVRIHAVDLDAGVDLDSWPSALGLHLLDFLGVRLADDVVVELDGAPGDLVVVPGGIHVGPGALRVGPGGLRVGPGGLRVAAGPETASEAAPTSGAAASPAPASAPGRGAVVVHGRLTDVAAWLAGRTPGAEPTARLAGEPVSLPEIGPWPSPYSPPQENPTHAR